MPQKSENSESENGQPFPETEDVFSHLDQNTEKSSETLPVSNNQKTPIRTCQIHW